MLYFIKGKTIHSYPVAKRCGAIYQNEQLRDTIPRDVQQCACCFNLWPGEERVSGDGAA